MVEYRVLSITKDLGFSKSTIHPVVIKDGNGLVLFDAGYPNQLRDFENALAEIGYRISDIRKVVVSHHDHDHMGSLKDLKEAKPDIRIVSSLIESKLISGEEKSLRLLQAEKYNEGLRGDEKEFGERFVRYLETINVCAVDEIVAEGDYVCPGVKVIDTPGHTPGHISLLLEEERILLAGDALAIEDGRLVLANPQFTLDTDEAIKSLRKIRSLKLHAIVCYHGNAFTGSIDEELSAIS